MCRAIEEMRAETAARAEKATSIKIALQMLADKMPFELIAKYTQLSLAEVIALTETSNF